MTFTEKLELSVEALEELLKDGMTLGELGTFVMALFNLAKEYKPDLTYEESKVLVTEAWVWAEARWGVIGRVNEKVDLPIIPEAGEAEMLEGLVTKIFIPVFASLLALKSLVK